MTQVFSPKFVDWRSYTYIYHRCLYVDAILRVSTRIHMFYVPLVAMQEKTIKVLCFDTNVRSFKSIPTCITFYVCVFVYMHAIISFNIQMCLVNR